MGYRVLACGAGTTVLAGAAPPVIPPPADTTAPVPYSATINPAGTILTVVFTETGSPPVLPASGATGLTPTMSGGAVTLSSPAISGVTLTATLSRTIGAGETGTLAGAASNITDSASPPNHLANFSGFTITNSVGAAIATPTFTAGKATAGLPLDQGVLPAGMAVQVGSLPTQTDVQTTYGDGSARFLIYSADVPGSGPLAIVPIAAPGGSFSPTVPTAVVALDVQERFQVLGTYTVTSGTLKVTLADDGGAYGRVVAGAVWINPAASPTAGTIKNAGDSGFSVVGSWTSISNTGYKQQGVKVADGTDGAKIATWAFTGLASGSYRVAVQWTNYSQHNVQHSLAAKYRIYDDTSLLDTVTGINQEKFPTADIKSRTTYTATCPGSVSGDLWLSGAIVKEWRHKVTPIDGSANPHPWLRVIFDVRVYSDAAAKVWCTVENCLNVALATMVPYDVTIALNGSPTFTATDVRHWVTARWCEYYGIGLTESTVAEDWTPFWASRAFVKYEATTTNTRFRINGGQINENLGRFGILERGGMSSNEMDQASGRAELGFFPDWLASYIAHKGEQKAWTIAAAYKGGSNPLHIREADGSPWLRSNHTTFWFDERGKDGGLPVNQPQINLINGHQDIESNDPIYADRAHQPSFVFPGYVLTGDRFLHDEMVDWANWNTLNIPYHSDGSQEDTAPRAMGWPLRNMAEALAFMTDGNPNAAIIASGIASTLSWCDSYAAGTVTWIGSDYPVLKTNSFALDGGGEYGASFESSSVGGGLPGTAYTGQLGMYSVWQQAYLTYAIQRCNDLGFTGGLNLVDRMCGFACRLFDSAPDWPANDGVAYYPIVGTNNPPGTWTLETTIGGMYTRNVNQTGPYLVGGNPSSNWGAMGWPWDRTATTPVVCPTWPAYAAQERMMARLGVHRSLPHALVAKTALEAYVTSTGSVQDADNLADPWY